jgi:hypothetical protein
MVRIVHVMAGKFGFLGIVGFAGHKNLQMKGKWGAAKGKVAARPKRPAGLPWPLNQRMIGAMTQVVDFT